jgi:uncharacterized protein (UPF0332 family)
MVSLEWCLKQKNGLEIVEPNKNMSESYLKMAEESVDVLQNIGKSKIWTATTAYYIFYYSLYSLMLRIGVKCEIHACSLEFMRQKLRLFYDEKDIGMINKAFSARINLQYYTDRPVNPVVIEQSKRYSINFFIKTKDVLTKVNEKQINDIRNSLR